MGGGFPFHAGANRRQQQHHIMQIDHQSSERNPDLTKLATRVGQLLRLMLSSDRTGEIISAAAALKRTLSAAGLDLYDLAAVVEAHLLDAPALIPLDDECEDEWKAMARFCCLHSDALSEREADFVTNILKYRKLTEKQMDWLADIHERLVGGVQ
jgi:hypothetical protein